MGLNINVPGKKPLNNYTDLKHKNNLSKVVKKGRQRNNSELREIYDDHKNKNANDKMV